MICGNLRVRGSWLTAWLLADGRKSADKGLPRGRVLGREGQAWLMRLEAESVRLRWLTGTGPGPGLCR